MKVYASFLDTPDWLNEAESFGRSSFGPAEHLAG